MSDVTAVRFQKKGSFVEEEQRGQVHSEVELNVNGEVIALSQSDLVAAKLEERDGWGNKIEFILAIIGYAVGLGNVWRFPYLCNKNGGGAFLIPYIISLVCIGIPVFFLELGIGQRLRKGPLGVWNAICPKLSGLGLSAVVVSFLVGIYYNMIVAWCLYYLFISFQKEPPYIHCPKDSNGTVVEECRVAGSTQYYWYREALQTTDSIDDGGGLNWQMCLCLLLAWILIFVIVFRGVQSVGKVVYFTALYPYLVLIIFFFRGVTLDGAWSGVKHMFTPDFSRLGNAEVWLEASTQIFYSLGLAFGGLIAMASYNPINNNAERDAVMVALINCGTSLFASIVVFSILGFKATENYNDCLRGLQQAAGNLTNTTQIPMTTLPINATAMALNGTSTAAPQSCDLNRFLNEVAQGPGLTFIAFTEAIARMDAPYIWSILFFTMLLTLGIGSMIGTFECVRTTVVDLRVLPFRKEIVGAILCVLSYLFGLLFCQRSGEYWLQMFDSFAGTIGLLVIGLTEIIIVCYIYGYKRFENDIFYMLGKSPNIYWRATWLYISPVLLVGILIFSVVELFRNEIGYEAWSSTEYKVKLNTVYPAWGEALCFILILSSAIFIPIVAVLKKFDLFPMRDEGADISFNKQEDDVEKELHINNKAVTPSLSRAPLTEFEEEKQS